MKNFLFLVTHENQLKPFQEFLYNNTTECKPTGPLEPNTSLSTWIAQYHPKSSNHRGNGCRLPAFLGWSTMKSAHQPLNGDSANEVMTNTFRDSYQLLPIDILTHPQDYPEYFI